MGKTLKKIALAGALTLGVAGCFNGPTIERVEDLNNDGLIDVLIKEDPYYYLFFGQKDGSFDKLRGYNNLANSKLICFKRKEGDKEVVYCLDRDNFRLCEYI